MMTAFLVELGQSFRPYQYQTALAIVATLLVIFGQDINNSIRRVIAKQHFIIRTTVFIFICAFGYGLATLWLAELLSGQLAKISNLYIVPAVVVFFIFLGAYAQKQRHI